MLNISIDVDKAQRRMGDMMVNIRDFGHIDVHDELIDWQVEDMHRHYPNVDSDQEYVSWFTLIWPRSRTYDQTHKRSALHNRRLGQQRQRRALSSMPRLKGTREEHFGSGRPILRPALFNRLIERMDDLLGERLGWARTGEGVTSRSPGIGGG